MIDKMANCKKIVQMDNFQIDITGTTICKKNHNDNLQKKVVQIDNLQKKLSRMTICRQKIHHNNLQTICLEEQFVKLQKIIEDIKLQKNVWNKKLHNLI